MAEDVDGLLIKCTYNTEIESLINIIENRLTFLKAFEAGKKGCNKQDKIQQRKKKAESYLLGKIYWAKS